MVLKSREKILIGIVFIVIAIWLFDQFYYAPQSRKISMLKVEVKAADQTLDQFLLLEKGVTTVETEVTRLEKELKRLNERMLKGEEFRAFLKHLAKESDPFQMKVISLIPREENLSPPEEKKGTSTFQYKKVIVQMVLHTTYNKLGTYLKGIEELPFLVNIDNVQIEKDEEIMPFLKVTMGLNMYIISL